MINATKDLNHLALLPDSSTHFTKPTTCSTAYWNLLWIQVMKNISTGFFCNCCTVNTGALGWTTELHHSAAGTAQWPEANMTRGQCQARPLGTSDSLNHPQRWISHSYWLQEATMTAGESRDPRKSRLGEQAHSQTKSFYWVSATKSILPHFPPAAPPPTWGSFAAAQNKAGCSSHRIITRVSMVSIKK